MSLHDDDIDHWRRMSQVALGRLHTINAKRDDWHLSREVAAIERFQRKLSRNQVNTRLFQTATEHINTIVHGRGQATEKPPADQPNNSDPDGISL